MFFQRSEKYITLLRRALDTGEPAVIEFRAMRKDGGEFWAEWRLSPVRDGNGHTEYLIASPSLVPRAARA